ncbi:hypothetical protein [Streptacidiphilus neutrinimicus]|uniref:hypothetical protein n=1 Tax=Streptacidiphilus neutrinimicus TaxID=105420 RepID=UPI0005A6D534|nr:hypothetical protein [Streptacidiphilus neutrinimicus]
MTVLERDDGVATETGRIDGALELGDGWAVRLAQGSRGRLALEVYADDTLLDVVVESALAAELLRGARRAPAGVSVLAWGLLPANGAAPLLRSGRLPITVPADTPAPRIVAGRFWLALWAAGTDRVSATAHSGAAWEELRVTPVRT